MQDHEPMPTEKEQKFKFFRIPFSLTQNVLKVISGMKMEKNTTCSHQDDPKSNK
jgi:hypothetical protein